MLIPKGGQDEPARQKVRIRHPVVVEIAVFIAGTSWEIRQLERALLSGKRRGVVEAHCTV